MPSTFWAAALQAVPAVVVEVASDGTINSRRDGRVVDTEHLDQGLIRSVQGQLALAGPVKHGRRTDYAGLKMDGSITGSTESFFYR